MHNLFFWCIMKHDMVETQSLWKKKKINLILILFTPEKKKDYIRTIKSHRKHFHRIAQLHHQVQHGATGMTGHRPLHSSCI